MRLEVIPSGQRCCSAGVSRWPARCCQAGAPSPGSGTGLDHGEVAYRITVMLGLFLQHHLEAAAHDVLLVGIRVRRLATAYPIEPGLGEPVDDPPHRGHAGEPRRE